MSRVPVPCCSSIYVQSVPSSTYHSALATVHAVVVSRSDQCYDWAHMRLHKLQSVVCSRDLAGCDTADYVITYHLDARQWTLVIGASRRHLGPVLQADIIPPHSSTFFISTTRGPSVVQFFQHGHIKAALEKQPISSRYLGIFSCAGLHMPPYAPQLQLAKR